jgi:modulator of FtsH protease HflK
MSIGKMFMAWNEPEGNKKDPWKKNNSDGPPDLDEVFRKFMRKLSALFGKGGSGTGSSTPIFNNSNKFMFGLVAAVILALYIVSGFYIIGPQEQAVITRFGKYVRTEFQGPHWIPQFIENKIVVNSESVSSSKHSGSMLTKDENIVYVEIEVQYRLANVEDYLFNVVNANRSLKQASESALRQVIGNSNLDYVMTDGRANIAAEIKKEIEDLLNSYNAGILVTTVALKEAKAPDEVKAAFEDVIKSREEKERLIHEAQSVFNKIVPEARGIAEQMRIEADAYKQSIILAAEGETAKFNLILPEYNKSPQITKTRLYIDAIEQMLGNTTKVLVDLDKGNNLVYLPIDQIMKASKDTSGMQIDTIQLSKVSTDTTTSAKATTADDRYSRRRELGE